MVKQITLAAFITLSLSGSLMAQVTTDSLQNQVSAIKKDISSLKKLKVSGYVQAQFQYADSSGQASVAGGNFASGVDKRFMIRRGRVKFQYTGSPNSKGITTSTAVLQIDATEKGLTLKDAFVKVTDPWTGWVSVTGGLFVKPFGHEIFYSSSLRESPERARIIQQLFPGERDLGGMLTIQGPKKSGLDWLKLEAGWFNGNGAPGAGGDVSDFDKKKDFSGRFSLDKALMNDKLKVGVGLSYYTGGYRIDSVNVFKAGNDPSGVMGFVVESAATDNGAVGIGSRKFTDRTYTGVDFQFSYDWKPGTTAIRAEFISGNQPGFASDTKSPNDKTPISKDIYNRNFNGGILYLTQNIMKTPFQLVVKYDWYDPNTDVKGDEIGKVSTVKTTNAADLKYDTIGLGMAYMLDSNTKITAYYDMVNNETSKNLSGYTKDRTDNVVTVRMQLKF